MPTFSCLYRILSGMDYPVSALLSEMDDLFDTPPFSYSGIFFDAIYREAHQKGIRTLLSGAGGDELVTSRGKGYKNQLWNNREYRKLYKVIRNGYSSHPFKSFISFAIKQNKTMGRLLRKRSVKPHGYYRWQNIKTENIDVIALKQRIEQLKRKPSLHSISASQRQRLNNPAISTALENNELLARSRKIEYRYPMYDIRLISLAYHIPEALKMKDGKNRYLFRKALSPYLPEEIIWNYGKKRIFSAPSVYQRIIADRASIARLIQQIPETNPIHQLVHIDKACGIIQSFKPEMVNHKPSQVNGALQMFFLACFLK